MWCRLFPDTKGAIAKISVRNENILNEARKRSRPKVLAKLVRGLNSEEKDLRFVSWEIRQERQDGS